MRLALLSDIHGNLPALEAVVADIARRGADRVVNLGDSLSGPLLPRETAQYLMGAGWLSIAGNHERQLLCFRPGHGGPSDAYAHAQLTDAEFAWLSALPATARLGADAHEDVLLCHGTPDDDARYFLESIAGETLVLASPGAIEARRGGARAALIACGHTHVPRAVRLADGTLVVNPGSVGLPAYTDDTPVFHRAETGSPDARYAIVERSGSRTWTVEHRVVPYDHAAMAALARTRNRPDWALALETGSTR